MNPAILAWALAQPAGSRWRLLAEAYAGGALRVTINGNTVEYRSQADIAAALAAGYQAEAGPAAVRPGVTYARFGGART